MVKHNIKKIVFGTSAAVYDDSSGLVNEGSMLNPQSYYGYTKKVCEELIDWYSRTKGIIGVSLRYFNVVGDYDLGYVDPQPENVMPILMEVMNGKREEFVIYGNDYDTCDGTCIRDYVHVYDLVDAHVKALRLDKSIVLNLGTGNGTSVLEYTDNTFL